jgi:cytochrome c oxidase assembly factor CtaG
MTPWRMWKLYRGFTRLKKLFQQGEATVSKSIFKSKVFWTNVLSATAELAGIIPLPPGTTVIVVNILNIALRFLTETPTHLVGGTTEAD